MSGSATLPALAERVVAGELDPYAAADEVVASVADLEGPATVSHGTLSRRRPGGRAGAGAAESQGMTTATVGTTTTAAAVR